MNYLHILEQCLFYYVIIYTSVIIYGINLQRDALRWVKLLAIAARLPDIDANNLIINVQL